MSNKSSSNRIAILATLWLVALSSYSRDFSITFAPILKHYSIQPQTDHHAIPTTIRDEGTIIQLNYHHNKNETSRFTYGLSYGDFHQPIALMVENSSDTKHYDTSADSKFINLNANYSYDIFLNKKLILNPEIGLILQKHYSQESGMANDEIIIDYKSRWPPTIGLNLNAWLKYPFRNGNTLGAGVSGSLPLYRVTIGDYELTEIGETGNIKSSFGFLTIGLTYSFDLTLRK